MKRSPGRRKQDQLLPDSGLRQSFGVGMAVREADPTKPLLGCISPFAELALGELLRKAEEKYKEAGGCRNWEKGMPVSRVIDGIKRHVNAFQRHNTEEDHLAAIMWNAMVLIHYRDGGTTTGLSFEDLDDRPKWSKKGKNHGRQKEAFGAQRQRARRTGASRRHRGLGVRRASGSRVHD